VPPNAEPWSPRTVTPNLSLNRTVSGGRPAAPAGTAG
jgi:hypothetical protein